MLSADSYTLPRRRSGRRRWVKLRVHTRRLANIGANAAELRGLLGGVARLFSWVGFLGVLLWGLVQRVAGLTIVKIGVILTGLCVKGLCRQVNGSWYIRL